MPLLGLNNRKVNASNVFDVGSRVTKNKKEKSGSTQFLLLYNVLVIELKVGRVHLERETWPPPLAPSG